MRRVAHETGQGEQRPRTELIHQEVLWAPATSTLTSVWEPPGRGRAFRGRRSVGLHSSRLVRLLWCDATGLVPR